MSARRARRVAFALALLAGGCGYRSLAGGGAGDVAVVLGASHVPDVAAADEVVAGVRARLAQDGVVGRGARFPRIEVEVLRIDEVADGVGVLGEGSQAAPSARAVRVAVVARAYFVREAGAQAERDTGDVRVTVTARTSANANQDLFVHGSLVRAAARRAGEALGARVLGHPSPSDDLEM